MYMKVISKVIVQSLLVVVSPTVKLTKYVPTSVNVCVQTESLEVFPSP